MVFLAVIPQTPHTEELLNALYANAGISGLGLLLTAIIQTAQNNLSLFEAIFTLHILFFLGTGASPMGKYHWARSRVIMGVFLQFASVVAFTGWGLYLWVHVNDYGSNSDCNDQIKYVIMFITVRATVPWLRGLWIAALVLSAVGLMIKFGVQAVVLFAMRRVAEEERAEETNSITGGSIRTGAQSHAEMEPVIGKPWYLKISIPLLLSAIYSTINLELTVHRNEVRLRNGTNVGGVVKIDDSWQFGQVLAVVMIIANLNEMVHFAFGALARRHHRHTLAREAQAQEEGAAHQAGGLSVPIGYQPRGPSGSSTSTPDGSPDKVLSGYELQNLENRNAVSGTVGGMNPTQSHDQPFSTLR